MQFPMPSGRDAYVSRVRPVAEAGGLAVAGRAHQQLRHDLMRAAALPLSARQLDSNDVSVPAAMSLAIRSSRPGTGASPAGRRHRRILPGKLIRRAEQ